MLSVRVSVLLLFSLSGSFCHSVQKRDDSDMNDIFRTLIDTFTSDLINSTGSYITLDNISESFGGRLFGVKFEVTGGLLGDLTTLRIVDVSVSTSSDSIITHVQVSLDHLEMSYSQFRASFQFFSVDGSVRVVAGSHTVDIQLTTQFEDSQCQTVLDLVKLRELDGFDVFVSNSDGPVNGKIMNKIIQMIAARYEDKLIAEAESKLSAILNNSILQVCNHLQ